MTSAAETRLVLRAGLGDREAIEEILTINQPRLLRYIQSLVGQTAAEDVLQETYLQICKISSGFATRRCSCPGLIASQAGLLSKL